MMSSTESSQAGNNSASSDESLRRLEDELEQQNLALESCWRQLESEADGQLRIPAGFMAELEDACSVRATTPATVCSGGLLRC